MSAEFPIVATEIGDAVAGVKTVPYLSKFPSAVTISQAINQIPTAVLQYPIVPNKPITFRVRDDVNIGVSLTGVGQGALDVVYSGQITDVGYSVTPSNQMQSFVVKGYSDILRKLYAVQLRVNELSENAHGYAEMIGFIQDGGDISISPQFKKAANGLIAVGSNIIEQYVISNSNTDPIEVLADLIRAILAASPFDESIKKKLRDRLEGTAFSTQVLKDYFSTKASNNAFFKQAAATTPVSPILDFALQIFSTLNYNLIDTGNQILFIPEMDWAEVPQCNVVFQDQILDMKVNFSFGDKPTRLRSLIQSIPTRDINTPFARNTEGVLYYPPSVSGGSITDYKTNATGEENRTGITPMSLKFGMAELSTLRRHGTLIDTDTQSFVGSDHVFAEALDSTALAGFNQLFSNSTATGNLAGMLRSKFLAARTSYSTALITTYLQPYIVPGLPMIVSGFFSPFIGIPVQVNHTIDSNSKQAITQISMSRCTNIVDPRITRPPFCKGLDVNAIYRKLGTSASGIRDINDIAAITSRREAALSSGTVYKFERDYNRRVGTAIPSMTLDQQTLLQKPKLDVYRIK